MALSKIDVANMLTGEVPNANVANLPASKLENDINFRNIIINGDMSIAQRGTSATAFASTYSTVDRFSFDENLGTGVATSEQETLTSGGAYDAGFRTAAKISCTTADASPSAGERAYMQQSIEAQNLQQLNYGSSSAKTITLSFWAKSNMTGNFPVTIKKDDNTIYYIVHSFNISSANTWQKFTFTITSPPTSGSTINNDNGRGMQIFWGLYWGSNYTGSYGGTPTWTTTSNDFADSDVTYNNFFSSTSNNLSITGVQLEIGTAASDFEFLPHDVNKKRCERYYQNSFDVGNIPGTSTSDNDSELTTSWTDGNAPFPNPFKTEMRAAPTVTFRSRGQTTTGEIANGGTDRSASAYQVSNKGVGYINVSSGTGGQYNAMTYELSAEL